MVFVYQKRELTPRRPRWQASEAGHFVREINDYSSRIEKWIASCRSGTDADRALLLSVKIRSAGAEISDSVAKLADALDGHANLDIRLFETVWGANQRALVQSVEGDWLDRIVRLKGCRMEIASDKVRLERDPQDRAAADNINQKGRRASVITSHAGDKAGAAQVEKIARVLRELQGADSADLVSNHRFIWLRSRETAWKLWKAASKARKALRVANKGTRAIEKVDETASLLRSTLERFELKPKPQKARERTKS
ncbi:hypothetical protein HIM_04680 [Hirsutella minnesotensis 3608]|uniref:Uncharacterized protein n=1 Tax=Hirsutella minnesotensis 3608 TaxID=1043627 RepID=A0A0F7ZL09_9HYPO|nr:hypothetical protein HIM_04680 [Hirsutella minnesotensis 3608]